MLVFYLISTMMSIFIIFLNHPLSMMLIILIQTLLIALISGLMNLSFWFSFIIFLIMIGGMMILFMYMISIASNEKFKFNFNMMMFWMINSMILSILILFMNKYWINFKFMNLMMMNFPYYSNNLNNFIKYFNFPFMMNIILMISYLLITMIASVKITNFKKGPLRQKF
uniref:NADH-ubiquinone oxidoreductase chain 6 n=1 Tax=Monotoma quadricollis TaxID=346807 RepID=A0A343A3P4_9CUCU|nr:NADH dehydrogenase subunit 6 [Monotoma quadricollis]AOY39172.1 NADH dehydrogenase subunit 6 [Monotoma quadricollis]